MRVHDVQSFGGRYNHSWPSDTVMKFGSTKMCGVGYVRKGKPAQFLVKEPVNLASDRVCHGRLPPVTVGMRIAAHPPRRSGRGRWTIRLLPRVLDGEPLVRPWVTDGYARPQDVGHAHQAPPAEAGSLGPPAQRAHPQASQPAREGTDEPMRPWDGKVGPNPTKVPIPP